MEKTIDLDTARFTVGKSLKENIENIRKEINLNGSPISLTRLAKLILIPERGTEFSGVAITDEVIHDLNKQSENLERSIERFLSDPVKLSNNWIGKAEKWMENLKSYIEQPGLELLAQKFKINLQINGEALRKNLVVIDENIKFLKGEILMPNLQIEERNENEVNALSSEFIAQTIFEELPKEISSNIDAPEIEQYLQPISIVKGDIATLSFEYFNSAENVDDYLVISLLKTSDEKGFSTCTVVKIYFNEEVEQYDLEHLKIPLISVANYLEEEINRNEISYISLSNITKLNTFLRS